MFKRSETSSGKVQCRVYLPWCIIIPFLLHQTCDFSSRRIKYTCHQLFIVYGKKKLSSPFLSFRLCLGALVNNFFSIRMLSCFIQVDKFKYQPTLNVPTLHPKTPFLSTDILLIHFYLFKNKFQTRTKLFFFLVQKKLFDLFRTKDWKITIQNIFPHLSNLNPLR